MVAFLLSPFGAWALLLLGAFLLYPLSRMAKGWVLPSLGLLLFYALFQSGVAVWSGLNGAKPLLFLTAGFQPPLSIALRIGLPEGFMLLLLYFVGAGMAVQFRRELLENVSAAVLFLLLLVGASGMIMTWDLFNLYVFLEITALATIGLLALSPHKQHFTAIFQLMTVEAIASMFFLFGIGLVYHLTGTLALSELAERANLLQTPLGMLAQAFLAGAILLELKPLLANGPAINVYETTTPTLAVWLSAGSAAAMIMALFKLLPLLSPSICGILQAIGLATFGIGHLAALRQTHSQRLLGYSSAAFLGLSVFFLAWKPEAILWPLGVLWGVHAAAKMLLFFLPTHSASRRPSDVWLFRACLWVGVLALLSMPPIPGFGAKWELIMALSRERPFVVAFLLAGFFVEAFYLLRWMMEQGACVAGEKAPATGDAETGPDGVWSMALVSGLLASGLVLQAPVLRECTMMALGSLLWIGVMARLPQPAARWLTLLAILGMGGVVWGHVAGALPQLFLALFTAGFGVVVLSSSAEGADSRFFHGLMLAAYLGGVMLLRADGLFTFFFAWEWLAATSFLLILLGQPSGGSARQYLLYALASAYFLLLGFGVQQSLSPATTFAALSWNPLVWMPILIGLAIKLGLVGWHTWVAPSYRDAPHDFTPALAGVVNKGAVFGLLVLLLPHAMATPSGWLDVVVWLGLIGALVGAFLALFEENFLTMLAYSSMGQMGYVIATLALMTHTGWVAALYLVINHFLYKTILFIAAAAVIRQVGTPLMYQMGGLIKRMPMTFASVLIAIIAMSGVPPLGGFGGKWLLYNALMERGFYVGAGLAFFASAVAFLYMYRILQTVFLGQLKVSGRAVRETHPTSLVAQGLLLAGIMAFSAYPQPLMDFLFQMVGHDFPTVTLGLSSDGTFVSPMGHWNPTAIMIVVAVVFGVLTAFLLLNRQKIVWVKQFNMVFAGERPDRPETTHVAFDLYAHYRRALHVFCHAFALRFWAVAERALGVVGEVAARSNTGLTSDYVLAGVALVVWLCLGGLR